MATAAGPETPATEAATAADAAPDVATIPDGTPATIPDGVPPADPDDLAQPGGPADRPKKKWPLAARVAIAVLSALVTLALINGGKSVLRSLVDKDHINNVAAGDCLRESRTDRNSPYRIVGCDDAAATHKALAVVDGSGDSCIHVAGATRSVTNRAGNVCLGPKDVDPAKAVNVAKEGDCLGQNGDEAQRVDCSGADAEYTVLKRIVGVPAADTKTACDDVPGAVGTYSWDWESELTANILPGVVDVLLCLGER
ncbi:hypothetical protein [Plantactinospora sp. B24E8]|uniref:LppU/SCO3897 family protein n=1 Tax=Plantactinospora sp. B24E8 TaxID=3153567 RepID=UPI00325E5032